MIRLSSSVVFLVASIVLGIGAASTAFAQDPALPSAEFADRNDIVLMPTEDFPFEFTASLAKALAAATNLKIRAILNLGASEWRPYSNVPQYDPARLKDIALPAIAQIKSTHGGSLYILLTTRDINSASGNLRFVFAESYPNERVSVISVARMLLAPTGQQENPQLVAERVYKMVLRTIGLMYFELPRSADPKDLMFSPLMSVDALDRLDSQLRLPAEESGSKK
jgi:predicted Zn-dependent protease